MWILHWEREKAFREKKSLFSLTCVFSFDSTTSDTLNLVIPSDFLIGLFQQVLSSASKCETFEGISVLQRAVRNNLKL